MVAVYVHPEERHEGEEVAHMEGGGGWIDTDIGADAFVCHELLDGVAIAMQGQSVIVHRWRQKSTEDIPSDLMHVSSLFQEGQHVLPPSLIDLICLFFPCLFSVCDFCQILQANISAADCALELGWPERRPEER